MAVVLGKVWRLCWVRCGSCAGCVAVVLGKEWRLCWVRSDGCAG